MRNSAFRCLFKQLLLLFVLTIVLSSCAGVTGSHGILAKIGETNLTEDDLLASMDANSQKQYQLFRRKQLDRLVARNLLEREAQRRKLSIQELLNQEIFSKVNVSENEIHEYSHVHEKELKKKKEKERNTEITEQIKNIKIKALTKQLLVGLVNKDHVTYFLPK